MIIVAVIATSVGGGTSDTQPTPTNSSSGQSAAPEKSTTQSGTTGIGQPVRDGKFEFTVTKVGYSSQPVGVAPLTKAPQGRFAIITLTVKNIGNEPRTMSDSDQYLYIGSSKYSADSEAGLYANGDASLWLQDINPGNQLSGKLVFDVPNGATATKLEVHDSPFSSGADISLR